MCIQCARVYCRCVFVYAFVVGAFYFVCFVSFLGLSIIFAVALFHRNWFDFDSAGCCFVLFCFGFDFAL